MAIAQEILDAMNSLRDALNARLDTIDARAITKDSPVVKEIQKRVKRLEGVQIERPKNDKKTGTKVQGIRGHSHVTPRLETTFVRGKLVRRRRTD